MEFEYNDRTKELMARVQDFMDRYVYPNEDVYYEQLDEGDTRWTVVPILEELKDLHLTLRSCTPLKRTFVQGEIDRKQGSLDAIRARLREETARGQ